jgi:hypothetical protein
VNCPPPHRLEAVPLIALTVGVLVRLNVRAVLWPHVLAAATDKVPDAKELLKLTVAVVVPWPAVIVALAGAVHT